MQVPVEHPYYFTMVRCFRQKNEGVITDECNYSKNLTKKYDKKDYSGSYLIEVKEGEFFAFLERMVQVTPINDKHVMYNFR